MPGHIEILLAIVECLARSPRLYISFSALARGLVIWTVPSAILTVQLCNELHDIKPMLITSHLQLKKFCGITALEFFSPG